MVRKSVKKAIKNKFEERRITKARMKITMNEARKIEGEEGG
jgi:hypothetical protein